MHTAAATLLKGASEYPGPTLTERELLDRVVDFANDGKLSGPLLRAPGVRLLRPLHASNDWEPTPEDVAPQEWIAAAQRQLRADLAAATGKGLAPPEARRIRDAAKQMVAIPADYEAASTRTRPRQRFIRPRWYYVPMNLEAILARAVLWLRDETLELGADLKQCALERCSRFFFRSDKAKARGRPRIYCCDEHMQEAHQATGPERTRRWRKSKAERAAKHK